MKRSIGGCPVTVFIGIAENPEEDHGIDAVIHCADKCMYGNNRKSHRQR